MRSDDVFIHGILPRSGTNYLSRVLRCHDDLEASPRSMWEFPHLRKSDPLVSYAASMARSRKLPELEEGDVLRIVGDAWLAWAAKGLPDEQRLVLKEPSVRNLDRFFRFFPRSYLLVLVRDGRDIACSSLRADFAAPPRFRPLRPRSWRRGFVRPIEALARRWAAASEQIRAFLDTPEAWERARVVRFEDLVRDPERELDAILTFLGLPPERFHWESFASLGVRGSSFVGDREGTVDWTDRSPAGFDPVGRWRAWSARDVRRFGAVASAELERWGYESGESA
ncbi:MAG TPA: sulfotransferase [Gemmatimonadota bacterium]|nr:sulfotransferase [Gemmatimonadota bacterium]